MRKSPLSVPQTFSTWSNPTALAGSKSSHGRVYAPWILLFCLFSIICRQTVLIRPRATTVDFSAMDPYAAWDIAMVCLAVLVMVASGTLGRTWSRLHRTPLIWLYAYYLVCAVSFLWAPAPMYSLYRAGEFLILATAALTVVTYSENFETAEKAFLKVAAVTILLQMCVTVRLLGFSWSLWHWHTNSYSASAAMLLCYCLGEYLAGGKAEGAEAAERKKSLRWYTLFSFATLALGTSAASNISAAVGCLLIFLILRRPWLLFTTLWVGLVFYLFGAGGDFLQTLLFPGKSEEAIQTATGRTLFWEFLWHKFLQSPVIGYGFGFVPSQRWGSHSHNALLTVLIDTGLVGLLFFGLFALRTWLLALGQAWGRRPGTLGAFAALTAGLANSLSMPLVADRWTTTSVVFIFLTGLFFLHIRNRKEAIENTQLLVGSPQ